ncbi:MFS transporter [Pigmentiphaga soli]|uniref:MFS transporter n=1 Tax=Pigmentiphaga soli TaxID=1007095 RepID=A0ABP8HD60_9BURK
MALQRVFPALAEPTLRRYLTGQVVSVLGSWTQNVTLNLVVYHLSSSAAVLALLNFLLYGPQLIIAPLVGARVTSGNSRRATLAVLYVSMGVACLLALLSAFDMLRLPVILALALVIGILTAAESPVRQVLLVSSLQDASLVPQSVAMNTMVYNVGRMVGPSIAAIIYPTLGETASFLCYAAALVVMAHCVRSITVRAHIETKGQPQGGLRAALAYVLDDRFTAKYMPILACMGLLAGSYQTLVPLLADQVFHDAAAYTGLFFACSGLGSLGAALLLSSALGGSLSLRFLRFTPWACCVALAMLATAHGAATSAAGFFLLGFSLTFTATSTNATMQRSCPDAVRGALVGMYGMAYNGTMPFGYLLVGSFSEAFTVTGAFAVMSAVLTAAVAAISFAHWRRVGHQ